MGGDPPLKPFERAALIFLLKHLAAGVAGAVVLASGLLAFDVAHLRSLACADDSGVVAVVLLYAGLIITLGGVAMGIGIMALGEE